MKQGEKKKRVMIHCIKYLREVKKVEDREAAMQLLT